MLPLLAFVSSVVVRREAGHVVLDNDQIRLTIDQNSGLYDIAWGGGTSLEGVGGEAKSADDVLSTAAYSTHTIETKRVKDAFGTGVEAIVHHRSPGKPEIRQAFWVYEARPEAIVRLELIGSAGSNRLTPVVARSPRFPHQGPLRSLFVPWDNDNYFRYNSDGWAEGDGNDDGGYEVGALYDDTTRQGLVVGSIDHDLWKTAVRLKRDGQGEAESLRVFAGVTSKYTHDSQPHGTVTGRVVSSPRVVLGLYGDWRTGLERYGDLNAIVRPPLPWSGGKPFFWNSWSGHKTDLDAAIARGATDFVHDELPNFRSGGTAYINFDAGGGKLTPAQTADFIAHAHALGLRAGTYWTPFACWSSLDKPSGYKGTSYRDLVLKDAKGEPLPKIDGAYPLDLSHPGTLAMIDRQMRALVAQGFDYVKLDFLSHGALEGRHFDPKVSTGTAAYNLGMKRIADDTSPRRIGRPFFISESIAPLFPQGYAHSRRISCDVFANIGASEYLLNSSNYAWWEANRLYRFNDPDSATVYQAAGENSTTEAEARTRFVASVVSGGMMILGDDLRKPEAKARVLKLFGNDAALAIARDHSPFRPVDGDLGSAAGDAFVRTDGSATYVAAFNFDKTKSKRRLLPLARLGLSGGGWTVHDLLTGTERPLDGDLAVELPPMDCALLQLERR